jgi:ABC-type transport system involved in cytochrome bd biosynthesis fused ATPase/permease subunit
MRLHTVQIIAGLLAAIAFVLAFMTAGVAILSAVCMVGGLLALAWVTRSLMRDIKKDRRRRTA